MDELFAECRRALANKDYSLLDRECREILKKDPYNDIALKYKAIVYSNGPQLAMRIIKRIYELYPGSYQGYDAEASLYFDKGDFKKALECCEKGLKVTDHDKLKIAKVKALIYLDRIDDAYEFHEGSEIANHAFHESLIDCGKYSLIGEYGNPSKEELVDSLLKRCECLTEVYNQEETLKVCELIFELDKDNEIALGYRTYSLLWIQEYEDALKCCNHAIELYPDNWRFCEFKWHILREGFDDWQEAEKWHKRYQELFSKSKEQKSC